MANLNVIEIRDRQMNRLYLEADHRGVIIYAPHGRVSVSPEVWREIAQRIEDLLPPSPPEDVALEQTE